MLFSRKSIPNTRLSMGPFTMEGQTILMKLLGYGLHVHWSSMRIPIKDVEDVCHGWCAIVVLGDFKGGDACFPELGVKIDCPPGTIDCSVMKYMCH